MSRRGSAARFTRIAASAFALSSSLLALGGCESGHSAKWYMAHGEAMAARVKECKANPDRLANDKDCQNAMEAFVTWARATGQK